MQAPFHALGILDPALQQVGFGIERAQRRRIQTAAGLDVIRGRSTAPTSCPARLGPTAARDRLVDHRGLGRSILAARNAIIFIPREPLRPGSRYRAAST
jgi:hypothetical protein